MQVDIGMDQKEKPKRSYVDMMMTAMESGRDPKEVEQEVLAEAEKEEQENPFEAEPPQSSEPDRFETRRAQEQALEGAIQSQEDRISANRSGLEQGLLGAIQTIGGTSLARSGVDAGAFNKGMESAKGLIQDPAKAAEQRRAYLMDRLKRTDVPYRALQDELVMKQRERGERIGAATEEDKIAQEKMDTGLKSADLTTKSLGAELAKKRFDATSDLSQAARAREVTKLKRTAIQIGRTDPGSAKALMDMANNLETNQNLSEQELKLLEDMKFTPPEDQSLEWFKARTARENALRPRVGDEKAKMLSDKQVQVITDFDNAIESARIIAAEKGDIDTGPISAAQNWLAQRLGVDTPEKTTFRARVGDQLAGYIKSISGATVTDAERRTLLQNIPKMEDNDATFNQKLEKLRTDLERLRSQTVTNIGRQGKDVSEFENTPQTEQPPVVTDPNEL